MANSAEFRRVNQNVTDLRKAVARMGFNMVRSVAVAFAMRQLRPKDTYTPVPQAQLERAWNDSLEISAMCFVIAKRFTRLNPDQALLTGLLHVLGRLYIIMRSKDAAELSDTEMGDVIDGWYASIGKAILESWGLPESLQHAVDKGRGVAQRRVGRGETARKGETDRARFPALRRTGVIAEDGGKAMEQYAEELQSVRVSLDE